MQRSRKNHQTSDLSHYAFVIIIVITRLAIRHMSISVSDKSQARMVFLGGHPDKYQPPFVVVCVCVCTALSGIYYSGHLSKNVTLHLLTPLTLHVAVFLQCHTDHLSPSVLKPVSIREIRDQKYCRRWDANQSPLELQASAIATRPP